MNELNEYYSTSNENVRLVRDRTHSIEFITSKKFLDKYIEPKSKVLDACAGTGRYAFFLAGLGHEVTAMDIVGSNVEMIRCLSTSKPRLNEICEGNACDMSRFPDESFDTVLLMGALYHIESKSEREKAISECMRVLKPGGLLAAAYINRNALFLCSFYRNDDPSPQSLQESLNVYNKGVCDCFFTSTPKDTEDMLSKCGVEKISDIGTDGIGYAVADKLNDLDDEVFEKWLDFHFKTCEDPSILGYSLHCLYLGRKPK